ncbi:MAG: spermidine synthase [Nocardioidaceae bacterium]
MSARFEELDWQQTPMGAISLRRRREPGSGVDIFEAKLDDDFLMSSEFVVAEVELARLGLAAATGRDLAVLVGGLGLGYTATAALATDRVGSLVVLEALPAVVGWHEQGLLPESALLTGDPRCRLVVGDFFAAVAAGAPLPEMPEVDVVLLDIDHSPRHRLHPSHAAFYQPAGLQAMRARLRAGGVFALWSDDPPDAAFLVVLREVFEEASASVVEFANHLTGGVSANTVYVATTG